MINVVCRYVCNSRVISRGGLQSIAMAVSEPSIGDIVAGFVEGAIVGIARVFSERPGRVIFKSDDIVVQRVTDHTGKDLEQALDLLENEDRIAPDELRSRDDMIRFVRDSNESGWFRHRKFRDHLLVARSPDQVEAMAFFTHYPRDRKSAVSYFVARRGEKRKTRMNRASLTMAYALATYHASLRPRVGLMLAEVDDPRLTAAPPERNRRCGRIKIFKELSEIQGKRLYVIDFPYIQPSLDPFSRHGERQMLLIFVPFRSARKGDRMKREELSGLLRWLYGRVYADTFVGNEKLDTAYRAQLAPLQAEQLQKVPDVVSCLDAESWLQSARRPALAAT